MRPIFLSPFSSSHNNVAHHCNAREICSSLLWNESEIKTTRKKKENWAIKNVKEVGAAKAGEENASGLLNKSPVLNYVRFPFKLKILRQSARLKWKECDYNYRQKTNCWTITRPFSKWVSLNAAQRTNEKNDFIADNGRIMNAFK